MHRADDVLIFLAGLFPGIGTGFSILMELLRQEEQNGVIDLLGMSTDTVLECLSNIKKFKWLKHLLFVNDVYEFLSIDGKETYVKDGFRMAEGDTMVKIRLDYDLGCKNMIFDFIVRNDVPVSCVKYGPTRVDVPSDGYINEGYINNMKQEWLDEGYVAD